MASSVDAMDMSELPLEERINATTAAGEFEDALALCERLELESCGSPLADVMCAKQMMLYLIADDLNNARFFWRRLDSGVKGDGSQVLAIWGIVKDLWLRSNIPGAYATLGGTFEPEIAPLASVLCDKLRTREFGLLSKAYADVNLTAVASALGLDDASAITYCTDRGWQYDGATQLFQPVPVASPHVVFDGLAQMESLSKHVTYLESKSLTKA